MRESEVLCVLCKQNPATKKVVIYPTTGAGLGMLLCESCLNEMDLEARGGGAEGQCYSGVTD